MYTLNNYIQEIFQIVKGLIIHVPAVAVQNNYYLFKQYGAGSGISKSDWRYYKHLQGEYHELDKPIQIKLLNSEIKVTLNKQLLEQYPDVKSELLKFDRYYNNLVTEYPDQESLIKGIMLPIEDIDKAIASKPGTILNYDKNLVLPYEADMIDELSKFSYDYISKWLNIKYIVVDEYYLPYILANLFSALLLKIMNIRIRNAKTDKAHPYHIAEYFNSNFDMGYVVNLLDREPLLWLYRNMEYIVANIGKNEIIDIVADKVFDKMHVGVGNLYINYKLPITDLQNDNIHTAIDNNRLPILNTKPVNSSFTATNDFTVDDILYQQLSKYIPGKHDLANYITHYKNELNSNLKYNNIKTKLLELDIRKQPLLTPYNYIGTVLDTFITLSLKNRYRCLKTYVDPNTKKEYRITTIQAVYILFKYMCNISNAGSPVITNYNYKHLYKNSFDTNVYDKIISVDTIEKYKSSIESKYPTAKDAYLNDTDFKEYINNIITFQESLWILSSNTHNFILSTDINYIEEYQRVDDIVVFNTNSLDIDSLLKHNGIELLLPNNYNYTIAIIELTKLFTGIDIDNEVNLKEQIKEYTDMLLKLTSYTVDVITNDSITDTYIPKPTININEDIEITIPEEGKFKCLNDFEGIERTSVYNEAMLDKYKDMSSYEINSDPNFKLCNILDKPNLHGYNTDSYTNEISFFIQMNDNSCYKPYSPKLELTNTYMYLDSKTDMQDVYIRDIPDMIFTGKVEYYSDVEIYRQPEIQIEI